MSSCGAPSIESPRLTAAEKTACNAFVKALPERYADQTRRSLSDASPAVAAWGDPAIVMRCGVDVPASFNEVSQCQNVDGFDWYAPDEQIQDNSVDLVLSAVGREPLVQVTLPSSYRPGSVPAALTDLNRAISAHTKLVKPCG